MSCHQTYRCVYQSRLISVDDCVCRPHETGLSAPIEQPSDAVIFMRRGVFEKRVEGERLIADANHVLFFSRGEEYATAHPVLGGDDCTIVRMKPGEMSRLAADVGMPAEAGGPFPGSVRAGMISPSLQLGHIRLYHHVRAGAHDDLEAEERLLHLMSTILAVANSPRRRRTMPRKASTMRSHRDLVRDVQTVLGRRFREPLSLDVVSAAVASSPAHLSRVFRREVGVPIFVYVNRIRLHAALEHLADGDTNLSRLAQDLGFSNRGHFGAAFRHAYGVTPSQMRAEIGSGAKIN